jgi:hypothetical protein
MSVVEVDQTNISACISLPPAVQIAPDSRGAVPMATIRADARAHRLPPLESLHFALGSSRGARLCLSSEIMNKISCDWRLSQMKDYRTQRTLQYLAHTVRHHIGPNKKKAVNCKAERG